MSNTYRHITQCLTTALVVTAFVCSCAQDEEEKSTVQVDLLMAPRNYVETQVSTRALADGYSAYVEKASNNPKIAVYFTQPGQAPVQGTFTWKENYRWRASARLNVGQSYYVYGFMPKRTSAGTTITGTITSGDYTQGATINLSGLSTATADDVCVIVGAKKESTTTYDIAETENTKVVPGEFLFVPQEEDNYLYVLMNHIYAEVALNFVVDTDYALLRTIKLKRLVMATKKGETDVTVGCRAPYSTISFTITEPETDSEVELFSDEDGLTISSDALSPTSIPAFFTPMMAGSTRPVAITSTYDVYDRQGNLTRENCTATNHFTLNGGETGLGSGDRFTVRATIAPTYLYILGNSDEDNPTITLE